MDVRDILKQGLIKCVGNGETTRILIDNWIPSKEMMRPDGSRGANPPELVSDLIDHM